MTSVSFFHAFIVNKARGGGGGVGNSPIKKLPGGWSGSELTDTLQNKRWRWLRAPPADNF